MNGPILGFRGWMVETAPRKPRIKSESAAILPGRYKADPGLEAWAVARAKKVAPPKTDEEWKAEHEPGVLLSLSGKNTVWSKPGATRFRCGYKEHAVPDRTCGCGLYACFKLDGHHWFNSTSVVGAIIAWGHIVFHGVEGFRAEYGRIVALSPHHPQMWPATRLAANRLGVPSVPLAKLEQIGREFGVPVGWEYRFG